MTRRMERTALLFLLNTGLAIVVVQSSCGGKDASSPATLHITITPVSVEFAALGEVQQLSVTIRDGTNVVTGPGTTWLSSDNAVATVAPSGAVTSVGNGTATITATVGAALASGAAAVAQVATRLVLSTASITFDAPGDTARLDVTVEDRAGARIEAPAVMWQTSDASIATVSTTGLVRAVRAGTALITAQAGTVSKSASIEVLAVIADVEVTGIGGALHVGDSIRVTAVARDSDGNVVTGRPVVWESSVQGVAAVDNGGAVKALAKGTTRITATVGAVSGGVDLQIVQPVTTVAIQSAPGDLRVGATHQLAAIARDRDGRTVDDANFDWSVSDAALATVSDAGLLLGVGIGRAVIAVAAEQATDSRDVRIRQRLASVQVGAWERIGPTRINGQRGYLESGKLQTVAWLPDNPTVMFAAGGVGSGDQGPFTQPGIFKSTNAGVSWQRANSGLQDWVINELFTHASLPGVILAGTETGGIYRSENDGATWQSVFQPSGWPQSSASDFLMFRGVVYAATGVGIVRSTDSGRTWSMELPATSYHTFRVFSSSGDRALAATNGGQVHLRDGDGPWVLVREVEHANIGDAIISPWDPDRIHIGQVDPAAGFQSRIFTSDDGGRSWKPEPLCLVGGGQALAYDRNRTLWVGCGQGLLRLTGSTWQAGPPGASYWDIRQLHNSPDGDELILGTDQGVFAMSLATETFRSLTADLDVSILLSVATGGQTLLVTVQDFSPLLSFNSGASWTQQAGFQQNAIGGEGGTARINPADPRYCYSYTVAGFQMSADGCRTFRWPNPGELYGGTITNPGPRGVITFDPQRPNVVYVASRLGVFRSTDWGVTVPRMPWAFTDVTTVAVQPGNSDHLLVAGLFGLRRSTDGGASWTTVPLPAAGPPELVAFNPDDPQTVLIATEHGIRYGGGLLRSDDGGATFARDVSVLPNVDRSPAGDQIEALSFGPSGSLALATTGGLYVSEDQGLTWRSAGPSTPPVWFSDVVWSNGFLYATTYGQGLIRAPVQTAVR